MIRALYVSPDTTPDMNFPIEQIPQALKNPEGLLWLDFCNEPPETCEPILSGFGFHPLAIDDALAEMHSPKVDDWGNYLYIVLNYNTLKRDNGLLKPDVDELDVFLGPNYVITHHDLPIKSVDETWNSCQRDDRHTHSGPDHLFYRIIDALVMDYMPLVEQIDAEIDELEDQVFSKPTHDTLERLFSLKRVLLAMRRILPPLREVLNKLARDDYSVIDPKDRVFFRDVYDHLVRLHDLNESMRDMVGGALDSYLSVINNRMNDIMKTLTVITTLFMPISFIAGFFGMNFFEPVAHLTGWTSLSAFYVTMAIVILTPILMIIWMRRKTFL